MSCTGNVYKSNHQQTQQDIIFLIYNNILNTKIEEKASGSLKRFQILSLRAVYYVKKHPNMWWSVGVVV